MVGFAVLRTTAASIRAAGPKCSISASTLSSTESWPVSRRDLLEQLRHRGRDPHRPLVPPDRGDRFRDRCDRVVGVAHRPVTGRPVGPQPQPGQPLLRGLDEVDPLPLDGGGEAADLPDPLGAALEPLRVLVGQRMRTLDAARLLVGREREGDRAASAARQHAPGPGRRTGSSRRSPSCRPHRGPRCSRPAPRRRTGRSSSPALAAGTTSRWPCSSSRSVAFGSPQCATTEVRPLRRLEQLRADPDLVEQTGDVLGSRPLTRTGAVAVVRGVDPDQVAADLHDLGLGLVRLRHSAHLAPRRPEHSPRDATPEARRITSRRSGFAKVGGRSPARHVPG